MPDLWAVVVVVSVVVGIPASVITIIPPWRTHVWSRVSDWRYRHSPYYRIDQLQEQVNGMQETIDLAVEHMQAALKYSESLDKLQQRHRDVIDDLVVLTARYWRNTSDRSPQRQRIIEAANGRDIAPLPKLPNS
jgi:hypothetical protein